MDRIRCPALVAGAVSLASVVVSPRAWAGPERDPGHERAAPPANTGFQAHLASGLTFPAGNASGAPGDTLGARYAWQWPIEIGLGAKPSERIYVGGYLALAFGAEGSDSRVERACVDKDDNLDNDVSCTALSLHTGAEVRYTFAPDRRATPWLSYGLGPTLASQNIDDRPSARSETTSVTGWDFARLGFGLDFRTTRGFGFGPYAGISFGRYFHTKTVVDGRTVYDASIDDPSWHEWLSIGARVVLFP